MFSLCQCVKPLHDYLFILCRGYCHLKNIISHTDDRHVIAAREMNDILTCTIYIRVHPSGVCAAMIYNVIQPHTHMHIHTYIYIYIYIYVCVCTCFSVFAYVCNARAPLMIHGLLGAQFSTKWRIIVNFYWCRVYLWLRTFISKPKQHLIFSECWQCDGCVCLWLDNSIQSDFNVSGGYV